MKSLAQLFDQISIREDVLVIRRHDDPESELTLVPNTRVKHIIRYYHEGPGGAHQAPKAISAKIIGYFWWADIKRDVRLYAACCPTCEKFIRLNRTPKAGLRLMDVGGRGDCLALDIIGGMDSLPLTPRGNRYILTLIDCFTRFAVAVPLVDQSAEELIASVIGHYITVYGTPRRILTDQERNFESDKFAKVCSLFRINKICTSAYHLQSNGICERFNQTLNHSLDKILSKEQQASWDIYLNFAVFSYNLSVRSYRLHSFLYYLRIRDAMPFDIVFYSSVLAFDNDPTLPGRTTGTPLTFQLKTFSVLMR